MWDDLRRDLAELADAETAENLQRFFKTGPGQYGEGDRFLGIRVPEIRRLVRKYRTLPFEHVIELLQSDWHEDRLLALLILIEQYRRGTDEDRETIYQAYLSNTRHINNWDLVDASAEHIVGAHLHQGQTGVLKQLAQSDVLWERRIAVMATFAWIKNGVFGPTLELASLLLDDPHDLIHKAVGWMLREIGRRDRKLEESFLLRTYDAMPRTMLRYAIEHFPEDRRQQFLRGTV